MLDHRCAGPGVIGGDDVTSLYRALGHTWAGFSGCEAHLLDGNPDFAEAFGLPCADSFPFSNGDLEVAIRRYVLGATPARRRCRRRSRTERPVIGVVEGIRQQAPRLLRSQVHLADRPP